MKLLSFSKQLASKKVVTLISLVSGILAFQGYIFLASEGTIDKAQIYQLLWISFLSIFLLVFCGLFWKSRYLRVFIVCLVSVWVANLMISVVMYWIYGSSFTVTFADSMLNSPFDESISMSTSFLPYVWLPICLFVYILYTVNVLSKKYYPKLSVLIGLLIILGPIGLYVGYSIFDWVVPTKRTALSAVLERTPFYNAYYFSQADFYRAPTYEINDEPIIYDIRTKDTEIENYVVVIGESARAKNMSLYGYDRKTTPNLDKQKDQMLVYQNAVSPAPITLISVPMVLSQVKTDNYQIQGFADNLVNLSRAAGFQSYWYSTQAKVGADGDTVRSAAYYAINKEWFFGLNDDSSRDMNLIKPLKAALAQPGKKIIVGSHGSSCGRYPKEETVFAGSKFALDDCYDNSIHYTDKILQEMFNALEDKRAILTYFSDHAQERDENRPSMLYRHGNVYPTREAYHVPFFIWYSPLIKNKKTGVVEELTPMTDFYPIMSDLMGIEGAQIRPPHHPNDKIYVLDAALNIISYDGMKNSLKD